MQTALFFLGFCCGLYCMMKSWVLYLAHSTCKYWALYTVHIFVLGFCSRRVCWVLYVDHLFSFFILGLHIQTILRMFIRFSGDICNPLPLFLLHRCFLNAKHRRLFRFREDGEYWARVTTAGFNKQNRQAVCEAEVQKYTQYRLAAIKKQSVPNIFFIFSYFCYTRSVKNAGLLDLRGLQALVPLKSTGF